MRGGRFARLSLNFEDIPYKMLKYRDFVASLNVLMIQKFATDPPLDYSGPPLEMARFK